MHRTSILHGRKTFSLAPAICDKKCVFVSSHLFFFPVRLKEHLRQKLIESGWRDNLKEYTMGALIHSPSPSSPTSGALNMLLSLLHPSPRIRCLCLCIAELIRSKGDTTMTVEQLTAEIIPRGRGARSTPQSHLVLARKAHPPETAGSGSDTPSFSKHECCSLHVLTCFPCLVRRDGAR